MAITYTEGDSGSFGFSVLNGSFKVEGNVPGEPTVNVPIPATLGVRIVGTLTNGTAIGTPTGIVPYNFGPAGALDVSYKNTYNFPFKLPADCGGQIATITVTVYDPNGNLIVSGIAQVSITIAKITYGAVITWA